MARACGCDIAVYEGRILEGGAFFESGEECAGCGLDAVSEVGGLRCRGHLFMTL